MLYLGIETSCDETGIAVVEKINNNYSIKSNLLATSLDLHSKTGGIIPERAAREQLKLITPLLEKTFKKIPLESIDAICVTHGPGLIGSLLVGVETAKTLAFAKNKKIIPVNHMHGHIYANYLNNTVIEYPALALVISGGHTDLVYMKNVTTLEVIGETRDDAAGEAFDKIGRLLNLDYPAGAKISKLAESGDSSKIKFPRPMINSGDFDFSFSGLKTSVLNYTRNNQVNMNNIPDICASVEQAIVDVLVTKTINSAKKYNIKTVIMGGGVSANERIRSSLSDELLKLNITLTYPEPNLCTDNGAMIAVAGFFAEAKPWKSIHADPELYY